MARSATNGDPTPTGYPNWGISHALDSHAFAGLRSGGGLPASGHRSGVAELLVRSGGRNCSSPQFLQPALAASRTLSARQHGCAVARLRRAIERQETLVVWAITMSTVSSTAFLVSVLRRFGLDPRLSCRGGSRRLWAESRAIDRAWNRQAGPLHRLDCARFARRTGVPAGAGVDAIVIDHHRSKRSARRAS